MGYYIRNKKIKQKKRQYSDAMSIQFETHQCHILSEMQRSQNNVAMHCDPA